MYNQALYNQVLSKKHHALRKPFDMSVASDFTDRDILPVTRMAMRLNDLFKQEEPHILDGQTIVFIRTVTDVPSIFKADEWEEIKSKHFLHELGYLSNFCADYESTIRVGLDKRLEEINSRLALAESENDFEGTAFLKAAAEQIKSVYMLTDKYKAEALKIGRSDIAEALENVPRRGATSFVEMLQFFRILHYSIWAEGEYHVTIGRFDQFAYPYLKKDIDSGKLTRTDAERLLEEFFLSFNWDNDMYIGVQLGDNGQSMMLGGVDKNGNDAYNMLSEMCLRASCELKLIDPKINLRVSKATPYERYVEGTRLTKAGLGFPQYSNDDVVIPALVNYGYSLEDARNYTVAACWEFILPGCAFDIPNVAALSYPKVLQEAMLNHLEEANSFDEFMTFVKLGIKAEVDDICAKIHDFYGVPAPLYSVLMDNCIKNARDISLGNKYNNLGVHGTGLATAADSLEAIREYIFTKKTVTASRMLEAIKSDFAGEEELLHTLRFETAKMGDNIETVDNIASELMHTFGEALKGKRNERGGIFRAGTGSAMFYLWHANEIEASADGRRKGEPFGTNFSPSLYVKSKGPFSVIQSFAKQPTGEAMNGGPLTMEFHSSVFNTDEGIEQVAHIVKEFTDLGGHQLQLNSINRERMLDAQKHPESYTNMIVRIWGWSAYFVELDKEYQDHLIARQEFDE